MSRGSLSCFNITCLKKKNKKQDKPVKEEEDVVEHVRVKDEESHDKKCEDDIKTFGYFEPGYSSRYGVSASTFRNDFNKVKTFDLRGATKTKEESVT
ncbi:unnamed protein product [Cochlearia groenlandica]